jgi:hypothetical protein
MNKDRKVLAREMGKLVKKWEKSGLTQGDFAKGEAVSLSKFKYWITKTKNKANKPVQATSAAFLPISFSDPAPLVKAPAIICFPNGITIELDLYGLDANLVNTLKSC